MIGDLNGVYKEGCSLVTTCDNFSDEETAEQWLYDFLLATNCFSLFRQQPGVPIYRHADQQWHDVRCDILAIPAQKLLEFDSSGNLTFATTMRSGKKMGAR